MRLQTLFPRRTLGGTIIACGLLMGATHAAHAGSSIRLPPPDEFGRVQATTFDTDGRAVGRSFVDLQSNAPGEARMHVEMAVEGGGHNRSEARFSILTGAEGGPTGLELLEQRSHAVRADGVALDLLVIDHRARRVSCLPADAADAESEGRHLTLPEGDRVVNVPMQLFFEPLVQGETNELRYQVALCRREPRLQDMIARRVRRPRGDKRTLIEVELGPDVGRALSFLAGSVLPSVSFWFDAEKGDYLAHRMPLHRRGPEMLLMRRGFTPPDLGLSPQ